LNIAILDSVYAADALKHILERYEIGEIAPREQLAVEVAAPILLRMRVPIDQLMSCGAESTILPIGAHDTHQRYNLTTTQVLEAARKMVSELYPFVDMVRASMDIGPRVFIAREIPTSTLRTLGFSILSIGRELSDALTVRLEMRAVYPGIEGFGINDAIDTLLVGLPLRSSDGIVDKMLANANLEVLVGTKTEDRERLQWIFNRIQIDAADAKRKRHVVWVRNSSLITTERFILATPSFSNMEFGHSSTCLLDSNCDDVALFAKITKLVHSLPGVAL
jgi:hypothetical protein